MRHSNKVMKVFASRIIPEKGIKLLQEAGCEVVQYQAKVHPSQEELISTCQGFDALISAGPNKLNRHFFEQCAHLRAVALYSVGYDNVDVQAAHKLGVQVGNTPGVLSNSTADVAFLLMLAVARKAIFMHSRIRTGDWGFYEPTAHLGVELNNKTLGIVGLGRIGFAMAKKCVGAYDMKVIYHNRNRNAEAEQMFGAQWVTFDELLHQSDVLSVHSNLSDQTKGLFDYRAFGKMKHNSIFVNTARGGIHNEEDLLRALQDGLIWGAGLDVTNPEPMHKDHPLLALPNVCVLPHIGSATTETRDAMAVIVAKNVLAGLRGEKMPYGIPLV